MRGPWEGRFVYVSVSAHGLGPLYLHMGIEREESPPPGHTYMYVAPEMLPPRSVWSGCRETRERQQLSQADWRLAAGRALSLCKGRKNGISLLPSIHPTIPLPTLPHSPPSPHHVPLHPLCLGSCQGHGNYSLRLSFFLMFLMIRTILPSLSLLVPPLPPPLVPEIIMGLQDCFGATITTRLPHPPKDQVKSPAPPPS